MARIELASCSTWENGVPIAQSGRIRKRANPDACATITPHTLEMMVVAIIGYIYRELK
jgi:hypothetical protein